MTTSANGTKINLIMGGGGVRLSAYVGALAAFRDMGVTFGAVAGASAGSIVGALLAAGLAGGPHLRQAPGHGLRRLQGHLAERPAPRGRHLFR